MPPPTEPFAPFAPLLIRVREASTASGAFQRQAPCTAVRQVRRIAAERDIDIDGRRMGRNTQNSLRGRRVLVAEDEYLICTLIGQMLHHLECTVVGPAHNLSEALQAIRTSDIDAALLDVQLGDADVYPAAEELKHRNIPFVVATGYRNLDGSPQLLRDAPRLTKPFNEQQLLDILTSTFVRQN
jgi:CheY-like chemotaxis protein